MKYWEIEELVNRLYKLASNKAMADVFGDSETGPEVEAHIHTSFKRQAIELLEEYLG